MPDTGVPVGSTRLFPLHPLSDGRCKLFCKEKDLAERYAGDRLAIEERSKLV